MSIVVGHGLLLKCYFADLTECNYPRPFLVIESNNGKIKMLNVSSIKGKAHKLIRRSNKAITNYNPPFDIPSFVKLDEIYTVDSFAELDRSRLRNGTPLDNAELNSIIREHMSYSAENVCGVTNYSIQDLKTRNHYLR